MTKVIVKNKMSRFLWFAVYTESEQTAGWKVALALVCSCWKFHHFCSRSHCLRTSNHPYTSVCAKSVFSVIEIVLTYTHVDKLSYVFTNIFDVLTIYVYHFKSCVGTSLVLLKKVKVKPVASLRLVSLGRQLRVSPLFLPEKNLTTFFAHHCHFYWFLSGVTPWRVIIISCLYYSQDTRSTNICCAGQQF